MKDREWLWFVIAPVTGWLIIGNVGAGLGLLVALVAVTVRNNPGGPDAKIIERAGKLLGAGFSYLWIGCLAVAVIVGLASMRSCHTDPQREYRSL